MTPVNHTHLSLNLPGNLHHAHDGDSPGHSHDGFSPSEVIATASNGQPITDADDILITFVLDRSGSMQSCRDATISGFNEFLRDQLAQPGHTLFSLTTFNTEVTVECKVVEAAQIPLRTQFNYIPGGMTALYDAVAYTIRNVESKLATMQNKPAKHLFVIMTDGEENSSKEWTRDKLFHLIKSKEAEGWDFVYLGANQDAYAVGSSMGIPVGSTADYASTPAGTQAAMASTLTSTRSYRSGLSARGSFFDDGVRPDVDLTPGGDYVSGLTGLTAPGFTSPDPAQPVTPTPRTPKTRSPKRKPTRDLTQDNSL